MRADCVGGVFRSGDEAKAAGSLARHHTKRAAAAQQYISAAQTVMDDLCAALGCGNVAEKKFACRSCAEKKNYGERRRKFRGGN